MSVLGVDFGTTHCKAGLFTLEGATLKVASRPTIVRRTPSGEAYFDPDEVWEAAAGVIREVVRDAPDRVEAVGVASMAETGLLLDRRTGAPRSPLIPWFDTAAQTQADRLIRDFDPAERFCASGLRATFKCSVAKILWLHEHEPGVARGAVWLSAADYIAYRLTGALATDYSLAGRTFAFRIDHKTWDADWLRTLGLSAGLFPPAHPSGHPAGHLVDDLAGLKAGTPVAVSGHDHVCAAFAMGATQPKVVFDSMGTAETLVGTLAERALTEADYEAGLMYGCHTARGRLYWMGGLSASGGSLEWLRAQLGTQPLTYAELEALLAQAGPGPTGLLYFPYLLGSGAPHSDPAARAAFIGLSSAHDRADLLKAVLEGAAYELEFIRQAGERVAGRPITALVAAGGGTRNRCWMQIKADVSGVDIAVPPQPEATLLGAGLLAGLGCGLYADEAQAQAAARQDTAETFQPDADRHRVYHRLYEGGYLRLQAPLREYYRWLKTDPPTS